MRKALPILIAAAAILIVGGFVVAQMRGTDAPQPQNNAGQNNGGGAVEAPIRVTYPKANDEIISPMTAHGEARGTWFFEANFPITVKDADGKVIGQGYAEAQGEWMTTEFVPFTARVTFSAPATETGEVVFEKANPSGLPEHGGQVVVPVRFAAVQDDGQTMTLNVYFQNERLLKNGQDICTTVFPVARTVPKSEGVARAAVTELLKGPTEEEKERGYITSIPDGVRIQSLLNERGVFSADFSEELERGAGGSCRVTAIYKQISETIKQFPTVQEVLISINGRTEDILQP